MPLEIDVRQLRDLLDREEKPTLLDVREVEEVRLAPFPGAVNLPMGEVPSRLHELDPEHEIVVLCHHGIRSLRVASFLEENGFQKIGNLAGGIDAWSLHVDPTVPRY